LRFLYEEKGKFSQISNHGDHGNLSEVLRRASSLQNKTKQKEPKQKGHSLGGIANEKETFVVIKNP